MFQQHPPLYHAPQQGLSDQGDQLGQGVHGLRGHQELPAFQAHPVLRGWKQNWLLMRIQDIHTDYIFNKQYMDWIDGCN